MNKSQIKRIADKERVFRALPSTALQASLVLEIEICRARRMLRELRDENRIYVSDWIPPTHETRQRIAIFSRGCLPDVLYTERDGVRPRVPITKAPVPIPPEEPLHAAFFGHCPHTDCDPEEVAPESVPVAQRSYWPDPKNCTLLGGRDA